MMDYKNLSDKVCNIALEAGNYIQEKAKSLKNKDVEVKGLNNFVTYIDKKSEELIVDRLLKLLPEAGFIVEENSIDKKSEDLVWVVDPLDGTTNFIHGVPCYSISIALMRKGEGVIGTVYEPSRNEMFHTYFECNTYLNKEIVRVSEVKTLKDSLLGTGFPYYDYEKLDTYLELFKYFMKNTHGVRRPGSAAVDLAYVASGRYDGFYEYSLKPWDVAAGQLLVKNAGGCVSDFSGNNNYLFGEEIIASNKYIFEEFKDVIKRYFK
ncbi:MAG: inositol monophosphatase [Bacteroidetes bacterium GWF2_29_10]|nr:MAG: inositol monophosphatase [Bacteroidetes bacterium GWF2_29_10]